MRQIHPVILSGGIGSRLWPLSRSLFPKQFHTLEGNLSLIQNTVLRSKGEDFHPPLVVCNQEHRFLVAEQMRVAGIMPQAILLEPFGRNTAPAAALAALWVTQSDPDGMMLVLPADHLVRDTQAFHNAIEAAVVLATHNKLVTFGIKPTSAQTGYGYIQRGAALYENAQAHAVARFVEKPDAATAASFVESGEYYWNSGMFAFKASVYLAELAKFEPEMLAQCQQALQHGARDLDFYRVASDVFAASKSLSIDYAVMERTKEAAVVTVDMGWSDIGSWQSLWDASSKDEDGNSLCGDVLQSSVRNSYLRSEGPTVAAIGVENLIVVATADAVLVSHMDASQDVKKIVAQLEKSGGDLHVTHRKVSRPWGSYESIDNGAQFQVKRITVKPGGQLSLQLHRKRAEHWVVVSGTARVTCNDKVFLLQENESTFIPLGAIHRLENPTDAPLYLIEVQSGSYLGEDDIVRFEDSYGR